MSTIICVCLQENLLYWCDARTDKIERINLETGENREVVLANNNMDMFSVSVFEGYIYWSDRSGSFLGNLGVQCRSFRMCLVIVVSLV